MIKKILKKKFKRILTKFLAKGLAKKIPVAGVVAGTAFMIEKGCKGDWHGASMELASGCVAVVPVYGTAVSCAIDLGLLSHDVCS